MDLSTMLSTAATFIILAAMTGLYEWHSRAGGATARPRDVQRLRFHTGVLVLALALLPPLRLVADRELFVAHAVQQLLLMLAAPPLLITGMPADTIRRLLGRPVAGGLLRTLTPATRAFVVFNVLLAASHLPPIYTAAMQSDALRTVLHLATVGASVLMWWPLLSPLPELPRLSYPLQMLYCFALSIPMSIVSVFIVAAKAPMYAYGDAPLRWGMTALEDQRSGGLVMWLPSGLFFYLVLSIVFWKWQSHGGAEDSAAAAQAQLRVPPPPPIPQA